MVISGGRGLHPNGWLPDHRSVPPLGLDVIYLPLRINLHPAHLSCAWQAACDNRQLCSLVSGGHRQGRRKARTRYLLTPLPWCPITPLPARGPSHTALQLPLCLGSYGFAPLLRLWVGTAITVTRLRPLPQVPATSCGFLTPRPPPYKPTVLNSLQCKCITCFCFVLSRFVCWGYNTVCYIQNLK